MRPHDHTRITRGRCSSLRLHRDGLAPSTFRRSPGAPVPTLKQATAIIPIVFPLGPDPIGGGLVTSLAQPGGNVTGLSIQSTDLAAKLVEFLREVVPDLRLLAIIVNVDNPASVREMREVSAAARTLGLQADPMEIRRAEDIAPAFAALKVQADALYVVADALALANRTRILTFALTARLPAIFNNRDWVQSGGLMSYGANFPAQFRRAAELVDKFCAGRSPATSRSSSRPSSISSSA